MKARALRNIFLSLFRCPEGDIDLRIQFDDITFEVQLSPFQSEASEEYVIVDTGCVLGMLKHIEGVLHRIEKGTMKFAILEITINEVVEHLLVSQKELSQKGLPIFRISGAIENFRKLLRDNRVKKIANPTLSQKDLRSYDHFGEDKLLAYVLMEGNFRAIATQDGALAKRVGDDRHITCERLWTDLRSQERSTL